MLQFEKQHSRKEYVRGLKTPNFPRARLFNLSAALSLAPALNKQRKRL